MRTKRWYKHKLIFKLVQILLMFIITYHNSSQQNTIFFFPSVLWRCLLCSFSSIFLNAHFLFIRTVVYTCTKSSEMMSLWLCSLDSSLASAWSIRVSSPFMLHSMMFYWILHTIPNSNQSNKNMTMNIRHSTTTFQHPTI